jgi:hypothetical protein
VAAIGPEFGGPVSEWPQKGPTPETDPPPGPGPDIRGEGTAAMREAADRARQLCQAKA